MWNSKTSKPPSTIITCVHMLKPKVIPREEQSLARWEAEKSARLFASESQKEFLSKLLPELAQQCRDAFCNSAPRTFNSVASEQGLLA
ncbi:uncharacterized protein LOC112842577 [Tachysurus ichikawai]